MYYDVLIFVKDNESPNPSLLVHSARITLNDTFGEYSLMYNL